MSQMQCTQFRFSTKHNISLEPQCPPPPQKKKKNSCMRSMPMFVFDVRLCLHVVVSKTSMVWILRWIYLRSEPYCLLSVAFLSVVF